MDWHLLESGKIIDLMGSSLQGLSKETVEIKRAAYGLNRLHEQKKQTIAKLLLNQFRDFMILLLVVAATVSWVLGDITDAIIILTIVLLNALLGFVQEYKAGRALNALRKMTTSVTLAIRGGQRISMPSAELVPGDIVLVEAGNVIPADLRLIEIHALQIDESSITGESVPVDKITMPLPDGKYPLGDCLNIAFKGTLVANGRGMGVVVATGMNTEIGKISHLLQTKENQTPLQRRLAAFGKKLSSIVIAICIALFVIGLLQGQSTLGTLLIVISLAVAAIPEALPALITVSLAKGAKRLAKQHALIRKLPAVETLGAISFICSDKTGTLTQNKMKVVRVISYGEPPYIIDDLLFLECAMVVNNDVQHTVAGNWVGDATETALTNYIIEHHMPEAIERVNSILPRIAELPFDPTRKCMTTVHRFSDQYLVICKGAVESIISKLAPGVPTDRILQDADALADEGMRVLAFSYKILSELPQPLRIYNVEHTMMFAGMVSMIDPPRGEVKNAIRECKAAGIKPVMITGDHLRTAVAIARKINLLSDEDIAISGTELAALTQEELDNIIERVTVYARVSPEQKLTIIEALQHRNHIVAMTGDGVNDAPSLRLADIGVAMGVTGTDVSKDAAHMVLLDDNFATIVKAVREGRRIYDNIRRFVRYIMTCNSAEIWTLFLASLLGFPVPLLPIHILWINLITDGLPGLMLASENAERNVMKRKPRAADESFFSGGTGIHILWVGILMALITLGTETVALNLHLQHWQTMVFAVLSFAQLGHVMAIRSEYEFIYKKGIFSNRPLLITVLLTFMLQVVVIYLPLANKLFKTQPLSLQELLVCIGMASIIFHAVELEKWLRKRQFQRHPGHPIPEPS